MTDGRPIERGSPPGIDRRALRRTFARAGDGHPAFARAVTTARDALLQRLDDIRIVPNRILDLGAGTGSAARELGRRFGQAEVVLVDPVVTLLQIARRRAPAGVSAARYAAGEAENLPLASGSVDLVLSSLAMPWFHPIDAALAECMRALRPGGLLLLTTLGPGTLNELSTVWPERGGSGPMHPFLDMHVLGDALVRAGFADVVMDVERLRFPAPGFRETCRMLSQSGCSGVPGSRRRGLAGVRRFRAAAARYDALRDSEGALTLSVEIVFGHAWAPRDPERTPARVVPRIDWTRDFHPRS